MDEENERKYTLLNRELFDAVPPVKFPAAIGRSPKDPLKRKNVSSAESAHEQCGLAGCGSRQFVIASPKKERNTLNNIVPLRAAASGPAPSRKRFKISAQGKQRVQANARLDLRSSFISCAGSNVQKEGSAVKGRAAVAVRAPQQLSRTLTDGSRAVGTAPCPAAAEKARRRENQKRDTASLTV